MAAGIVPVCISDPLAVRRVSGAEDFFGVGEAFGGTAEFDGVKSAEGGEGDAFRIGRGQGALDEPGLNGALLDAPLEVEKRAEIL